MSLGSVAREQCSVAVSLPTLSLRPPGLMLFYYNLWDKLFSSYEIMILTRNTCSQQPVARLPFIDFVSGIAVIILIIKVPISFKFYSCKVIAFSFAEFLNKMSNEGAKNI